MQYFHIGNNQPNLEKFHEIDNPYYPKDDIKPLGGLWLTPHLSSLYNEWIDYLMCNRSILYAKYGFNSFIPCMIINLKNCAKIYHLKDFFALNYLKKQYPHSTYLWDYTKLKQDYDGIFINHLAFLSIPSFQKLAVKTLILFNLNCIDTYHSGEVNLNLDSFDYTDYAINIQDEVITCDFSDLKRIRQK